ncbi:MAG: amino acid adenylation domain-containing protein, partial [Acidobacteriota bacterium]
MKRLINAYGPTENTTYTCCQVMETPQEWNTVPIGPPIANTQVYVLDRQRNLVAEGVAGELYAGGDGLARGYAHRPDWTAERFVPHPFGRGQRLYRTGDLVRWRGDGSLEFLGRLDHQVKIRGFRVEPGEVEAALAEHPSVSEAVLMLRGQEAGEKRLIAYLVSQQEPPPSGSELRSHLQHRLPDFMLPSAYVLLPALPLTPNGKLDRSALPRETAADAVSEYQAPRTLTEELLCGIWSDLLGVEKVGINDSFFELGGHSLRATQVISRIRRALGVELGLRAVFETPLLAELAGLIDEARIPEGEAAAPPLVPISRDQDLPLSFAQQRLWFFDQLEPGSPLYNVPAALLLNGSLAVAALEAALNEALRRHEALRTVFPAREGKPLQVIRRRQKLLLPVVDLIGLPEPLRSSEFDRLRQQESRRSFDLASDLLLRTHLVRLAEEEHALLATMHHIVSDGWSAGVLVRELGALYQAFSAGQPSPLEDLPIQYADFAAWQRRWLSGDLLQQQLAYWEGRLANAPAALELPSDHPRPSQQTFWGALHTFVWPPELMRSLQALSRSRDVTLYMTLLAAFQTLLSRYSGQQDLCVGCPIANRTRAETEGLIGFFVNTLVMRIDLSGMPTFHELLGRVREASLGAFAHQDLPFEQLVQALQPERTLSRAPLFQVMFALQNAPEAELELAGLKITPLEASASVSQFDLSLLVTESPQGLAGMVEYSLDLFQAVTIGRMMRHLRNLLEAAAANPRQRLGELPLLSRAERQQMLSEWNDTFAQVPHDSCIQDLFQLQAERWADSVAAEFQGRLASYAELNRRANRLAFHLRSLGAGPEIIVGLCLARGLEMVVGLLGILKSGAAYLPLDPSYPQQRLDFMLQESQAPLLVTQAGLVEGLAQDRLTFVCLDSGRPAPEGSGRLNPPRLSVPENAAYVIYTSGSTGTPKGVVVEHRSFVSYIEAAVSRYALGRHDRSLQLAPISFDVAAEEAFTCLCSGGTLVLRHEGMLDSSALFLAECRRAALTVINLPTAFWHQLAADIPANDLSLPDSIRLVIFGGERALPKQLEVWQQHAPSGMRLLHGYGPTEATVAATAGPPPQAAQAPLREVPIGRPFHNTQIYLLDALLQPVPIGVPGQLHIGGPGVARGYLGHPQQTAEKFIPDPFSRAPGARLYRSGDLAGSLPGGSIEFLDRIDHQVKIRGFRIEPGEVEAVLGGHPGLKEVAVLARQNGSGAKRLVAYAATASGSRENSSPSASELRGYLEQRLPDYMVPSAFVLMEKLPLTRSGKLDRKALPEEVMPQAEGAQGLTTPVEELLAGIWSDVLGLEGVGPQDNFFDLGGHSLLATQVISRIQKAFGVGLPLKELFASPRLEQLARRIQEASRQSDESSAPPLVRVSRHGKLPLSFAQQRLWFLDQLEPGSPLYSVPAAVELKGRLDLAALQASLNEVIRRHEVLRTRFPEVNGTPSQLILSQERIALAIVDLSACSPRLRQAERERLTFAESRRPFDLAKGPLLRAQLIRLGARDHILHLTMHHIVSDGWSGGVLVQELTALFEASASGRPSPLQELPIQYADFSFWQRQWLGGQVRGKQLDYWKRQLKGAPAFLELPVDRPRPQRQTYRGATQSFTLSNELSASLKTLSRSQDATLFMTLLAAYQTLLHRYSRQDDLCVGIPIANRVRAETERLIGFFINTLVLRTDFSGRPTFRQLLSRVRQTALDAYAHQDVPFEQVVDALQVERSSKYTPLAQVMFSLQDPPLQTIQLPGLSLRLLDTGRKLTKRDLTLVMAEEGGRLSGTWI